MIYDYYLSTRFYMRRQLFHYRDCLRIFKVMQKPYQKNIIEFLVIKTPVQVGNVPGNESALRMFLCILNIAAVLINAHIVIKG